MRKKVFLFVIIVLVLLPLFLVFKIPAFTWLAISILILYFLRKGIITLVKNRAPKRKSGIKEVALCTKCHKLALVPSINQIPRYNPPQCVEEPFTDDLQEFKREHSGHKIKYLEVIFGLWQKGKVEDPMAPTYLVALHEGIVFFIKRFREKIEEPMRYSLLKGVPPGFKLRGWLVRLLFVQ